LEHSGVGVKAEADDRLAIAKYISYECEDADGHLAEIDDALRSAI